MILPPAPGYTANNMIPSPGLPPPYDSTGQPVEHCMYDSGPAMSQDYAYRRQSSRLYKDYSCRQSRALGTTMIVSGILCIIFTSTSLSQFRLTTADIIGFGNWGGVLYVITGSFGVSAARNKTLCKIVTFMVLSIISAILSALAVSFSILGVIQSTDFYWDYSGQRAKYNSIIALQSMEAILGVIVAVAAIWGSILCCKAACCCRNREQILMPFAYNQLQDNHQLLLFTQQSDGQFVPYSAPLHFVPMHYGPMQASIVPTIISTGTENNGFLHSADNHSGASVHTSAVTVAENDTLNRPFFEVELRDDNISGKLNSQ